MSFKIHSVTAEMPAWEWLPTNAATYLVGDAAVYVSGYVTTVSSGVGQDTDEGSHYICMANTVVETDGDLAPWVKAANPNVVWETTLSAEDTDIANGLLYCIHTDGRQHDGTTTKGCFQLTYFAGTAISSICRGIFTV
jgi:hypothetical protein